MVASFLVQNVNSQNKKKEEKKQNKQIWRA